MFGSAISKLLLPICIIGAAGYWVFGPHSPLAQPENSGPSKVDLGAPVVDVPSTPRPLKHVTGSHHPHATDGALTPVVDVVADHDPQTAKLGTPSSEQTPPVSRRQARTTQDTTTPADSDSVAIAAPAARPEDR